MGIFDWLKMFSSKKEEKQLVIERISSPEPIKAYPETADEHEYQTHLSQKTDETTVESVDQQQTAPNEFKQLNKQLQTVESVDKHQPPFVEHKKIIEVQSTHNAIKHWEDTISA